MRKSAEIGVDADMTEVCKLLHGRRQAFDHTPAKHYSAGGAPNPAFHQPAAPPCRNVMETGDVELLHPVRRGWGPAPGLRQRSPGRPRFERAPFLMPVT